MLNSGIRSAACADGPTSPSATSGALLSALICSANIPCTRPAQGMDARPPAARLERPRIRVKVSQPPLEHIPNAVFRRHHTGPRRSVSPRRDDPLVPSLPAVGGHGGSPRGIATHCTDCRPATARQERHTTGGPYIGYDATAENRAISGIKFAQLAAPSVATICSQLAAEDASCDLTTIGGAHRVLQRWQQDSEVTEAFMADWVRVVEGHDDLFQSFGASSALFTRALPQSQFTQKRSCTQTRTH